MNSKKNAPAEKNLSFSAKGAAALAIGLGLGVCAAQPAEATVIDSAKSGFTPVKIENDEFTIDFNNDGISDFTFASQYRNILNQPYTGDVDYMAYAQATAASSYSRIVGGKYGSGDYYVSNLSYGNTVDSGSAFISSFSSYDAQLFYEMERIEYNGEGSDVSVRWYDSTGKFSEDDGSDNIIGKDGYMGFSIGDSDETLYGWIHILIDPDLQSITLDSWAYEDSGESITVGQMSPEVPLPSSLLLLATGAAGLAGFRKRKRS